MTDKNIRPFALLLAAQVVLVAALLIWAAQGFPLPSAITGPGERVAGARRARRSFSRCS